MFAEEVSDEDSDEDSDDWDDDFDSDKEGEAPLSDSVCPQGAFKKQKKKCWSGLPGSSCEIPQTCCDQDTQNYYYQTKQQFLFFYCESQCSPIQMTVCLCDSGCDSELFENMLNLRELRLDLEELLAEKKKGVEALKKMCDTVVKKVFFFTLCHIISTPMFLTVW